MVVNNVNLWTENKYYGHFILLTIRLQSKYEHNKSTIATRHGCGCNTKKTGEKIDETQK